MSSIAAAAGAAAEAETATATTSTSRRIVPPLFHLVTVAGWDAACAASSASEATYYPPTYDADGFTHLTSDPNLLLDVANHFYRDVSGEHIVLELHPSSIVGEVKWEPAAPVGEKETKKFSSDGSTATATEEPLFPHLYGGINASSVVAKLPVERDASGTFLAIRYPHARVGEDLHIATAAAAASPAVARALCDAAGSGRKWMVLHLSDAGEEDASKAAIPPEKLAEEVFITLADTRSTDLPVLECLEAISRAREAGSVVLVVSPHARSRAAAIVVAQLMFTKGTQAEEELAELQTIWPRAAPNATFMSELQLLGSGDGHDPNVALRATAEILAAGGPSAAGGAGDNSIHEDEVANVIEIDEEAPAPDDLEDDAAESKSGAAQEGEDIVETAAAVFRGHTEPVYVVRAARVGSTGRSVAVSGGGDDRALMWDPQTGESLHELAGHAETVNCVEFNHDGTLVATGALDGEVRVWNAETGELVQQLEGPSEDVEWLGWHPRGNVILVGSADMLVWMFMAATGQCMQVFSGHSGRVTCGQFTPDGKTVVTGGSDGTVRVWNPKSGKCRATLGMTQNKSSWHDKEMGGILSLAVSDDSTTLISGGEDGVAWLSNLVRKKERPVGVLRHRREGKLSGYVVESVAFSHEQQHLQLCATAGSAGLISVFDRSSMDKRYECKHKSGVVRVEFLRRHPLLMSCSVDLSVRLWESRTGAPVRAFTGHSDVIMSLAALEGDTLSECRFFSCGDDNECRVYTMGDAGAGPSANGEHKQ